MSRIKEDLRPLGKSHSWAKTYGTYIAGEAAIAGADATAHEMERRWGAGRLRLLVDTALREKFDRQRFKFNAAIWHGDLEAVKTESERMTTAWRALDAAARAAGAFQLSPMVWEVRLADGAVAAIVPDTAHAKKVTPSGRDVVVYTLEEIGRLIDHARVTAEVKLAFPGAEIEAIRPLSDPLDALRDGVSLDDTIADITTQFQ